MSQIAELPESPPVETAPPQGVSAAAGLTTARSHFKFIFLGELGNKVFRFAAALVLARSLSTSAFGLFNVGIAIAGILLMATTIGLPELAARDIAIHRDRASWIAGRVVPAQLSVLLSVVGIGLLVLAMLVASGREFDDDLDEFDDDRPRRKRRPATVTKIADGKKVPAEG